MITRLKFAFLTVICALTVACGGGGGGGGFLPEGPGVVTEPLAIDTESLPPLTAVPYAEVLEVSGGAEPYDWEMVDDDGTGLTIDENGVLRAETGASPGRYAITIKVTDSAGETEQLSLTIDIELPQLAISTTALPSAAEGAAYTAILEAEGGVEPLQWELLSDAGTGLSLSSDEGILSGSPSVTPGTYGLTFQVSDANGLTDQQSLLLEVTGEAATPLSVGTSSLPVAREGERYAAVLVANGGTGDYTWTWVSDGLSDLGLTPDGVIVGDPPPAGAYGLTFKVSDGFNEAVGSAVLTVDDFASPVIITTSSLPEAFPGTPYAAVIEASGGETPYSWTLLNGGGTGFALSSSGVLSGTPGAAGTYGITVRVSDNAGGVESRALTVQVGDSGSVGDALLIATAELPRATASEPYAVVLRAFGGDGNYTWSVRTPPANTTTLDFAAGDEAFGLLSGTAPGAAGSYTVTVEVRDGGTGVDIKEYTLVVDP